MSANTEPQMHQQKGSSTVNGILVVGGGKMGLSHLAILNRLLDAGQVAVVDPSRLTRFVFGQMGIRTFASLDQAFQTATQWRGAVIASPTGSHYPIARTLLGRKIPCFVEKPLTLDPLRSRELVDLQKQAGVPAQMGLVLRFLQPFVRLRAIARSGVLGAPRFYRARMLGNVVTKPDNGSWRTDYRRGGGCLNEYGPHLIDLCRAVFGDVDRIERASIAKVHSTLADDRAQIEWQHASGVRGNLELDWCDTSRRKSYTDFDAEFELGSVHANVAEISVRARPGADVSGSRLDELTRPTLPFPVNFYLRGEEFTLQLEMFLERALGRSMLRASLDQDLAATLEDGLAADLLIHEAAKMGGLA